MNEKMNKALAYFGRKDLTDGLYENDIDDNVQVFLTIRQMIKLYNLQSKIDKAIDKINQYELIVGYYDSNYDEYDDTYSHEIKDELLDILKEDK